MMYPPELVEPMRKELTTIGLRELRTAPEVESYLTESAEPTLLVINSICGCSAGAARPAVKLALLNNKKPARMATVFAGQDSDATAKARELIVGYPPSSPMIVLFKDRKPVFAIERKDIERRIAPEIASDLVDAFNTYL